MNCSRLQSIAKALANALTNRVLAVPGTPSISTWPWQSSAIRTPVTAASCPTTALATSSRTARSAARGSAGDRSAGSRATNLQVENGQLASERDEIVVALLVGDRTRARRCDSPERPVASATAATTAAWLLPAWQPKPSGQVGRCECSKVLCGLASRSITLVDPSPGPLWSPTLGRQRAAASGRSDRVGVLAMQQ